MKKTILSLILMLFNMTILLNAQSEWGFSRFFHDKNETGYEVSVSIYSALASSWTINNYPLSNEDTKTLIDILSTCNWEEYRQMQEDELISKPDKQQGYYIQTCYLTITHPDKRKVTLEINNGGIERGEYEIRYPNGNGYNSV